MWTHIVCLFCIHNSMIPFKLAHWAKDGDIRARNQSQQTTPGGDPFHCDHWCCRCSPLTTAHCLRLHQLAHWTNSTMRMKLSCVSFAVHRPEAVRFRYGCYSLASGGTPHFPRQWVPAQAIAVPVSVPMLLLQHGWTGRWSGSDRHTCRWQRHWGAVSAWAGLPRLRLRNRWPENVFWGRVAQWGGQEAPRHQGHPVALSLVAGLTMPNPHLLLTRAVVAAGGALRRVWKIASLHRRRHWVVGPGSVAHSSLWLGWGWRSQRFDLTEGETARGTLTLSHLSTKPGQGSGIKRIRTLTWLRLAWYDTQISIISNM